MRLRTGRAHEFAARSHQADRDSRIRETSHRHPNSIGWSRRRYGRNSGAIGNIKSVPEATGVDAVLKGTIKTVRTSNVGFTNVQAGVACQIEVLGGAEFKDFVNNKVLWSNQSFRNSTDYDLTSSTGANDLASIFTQDRNALLRISHDLAKSLVTQILDNF
jgi:hypothetical protein